jgi:hypothetical protein
VLLVLSSVGVGFAHSLIEPVNFATSRGITAGGALADGRHSVGPDPVEKANMLFGGIVEGEIARIVSVAVQQNCAVRAGACGGVGHGKMSCRVSVVF